MSVEKTTLKTLKIIQDEGNLLSEATLRKLWEFRLSIMQLKPEVSPEEDYTWFKGICEKCPYTFRFENEDGEIKGMLVGWGKLMEIEGKTILGLHLEFGLVAKEYRRKHYLLSAGLMLFRNLVKDWIKYPLYIYGHAYLQSFLVIRRYKCKYWSPHSKNIPSLVNIYMNACLKELAGSSYDENKKAVSMHTIPPQLSADYTHALKHNPTFQEYEQLVPNWREGYGLPIVFRFQPKNVWELFKGTLRRRRSV